MRRHVSTGAVEPLEGRPSCRRTGGASLVGRSSRYVSPGRLYTVLFHWRVGSGTDDGSRIDPPGRVDRAGRFQSAIVLGTNAHRPVRDSL